MILRCTYISVLFCLVAADAAVGQSATFVVPDVVTLRQSAGTYTSPNGSTVLLQGYRYAGDGGGGTFVNVPASVLPSGYCMSAQGSISQGSNQITGVSGFPAGLDIQMTALGPPSVFPPPPVTVTAYSVANGTITLSANASTAVTGATFHFGGDNGGTTLMDSAGNCFLRTTTTYSQKEWGAVSDGTADDKLTLQAWLNSNQPHVAVAGNSIVDGPLYCGTDSSGNVITDGFSLQGPPPISVSVAAAKPQFVITAASSFPGSAPAMLTMGSSLSGVVQQPLCSISAVGLIGQSGGGVNYDIVDAYAEHSAVLNHSQLFGGKDGFNCQNGGIDMDVDDSSITESGNDGIQSSCPNMKILRNVISSAGSDGVHVGGSQVLIEGNVIQGHGGSGVYCDGGVQLGIVGNYFDQNGQKTSGYGVYGNGCQAVSISGNQFHRSDQYDEANGNAANASHVHFDGANDGISMAANVYFMGNDPTAPWLRPDYILELGTSASITNFSFADSPTPQNGSTAPGSGVFGPNALAALGPFVPPNSLQNYLSGLVTSLAGGAQISIAPGVATDSANLQTMNLRVACPVNLNNTGVGGLDVGGGPQQNQQYNFFIFAQGGNATPTQCIASTALSPNFAAASAPHVAVYGFATGSTRIVNVTPTPCTVDGNCPSQNPFGGVAVGDRITDALGLIPSGTTITSLQSAYATLADAVVTANSIYVGISPGDVPSVFVGEFVGDTFGGGKLFSANAYVESISLTQSGCGGGTPPCLVLSAAADKSGTGIVASGVFSITMSQPASGSSPWCNLGCTQSGADQLSIYNDRYRLVASLHTNQSNSNLVPYTQDGDTFYLTAPALAFNGTVNQPPATPIVISQVPRGLVVRAFGRCVGGSASTHHVILYSPGQNGFLSPQPFPFPPGYDVDSLSPPTASRFNAYTDTNQTLEAVADGAGVSLQCMLDGWSLPR